MLVARDLSQPQARGNRSSLLLLYTSSYVFIPGLESVSHGGNEIGICSMLLPQQVGIEYMEIMNCMV